MSVSIVVTVPKNIRDIKGTVSIISSDPPRKDGNVWFTMTTFSDALLLRAVIIGIIRIKQHCLPHYVDQIKVLN